MAREIDMAARSNAINTKVADPHERTAFGILVAQTR